MPLPYGILCLKRCLLDFGESSGELLGGGCDFAQDNDGVIGAVNGEFFMLSNHFICLPMEVKLYLQINSPKGEISLPCSIKSIL